MTEIAGRTALVVGAASGMGRAAAIALAVQGALVHVADANVERLRDTEQAVSGAGKLGRTVGCDVTSDEQVTALANVVLGDGPLDVLIHTPGMALAGPPDRVALADWQQLLNLNVLGTVRVVNAFAPAMVNRGTGHVVLTGSEAGFVPHSGGLAPYAASKAAVNAYAEGLALFLRPKGVNVSLLCPGVVSSNFGELARLSGSNDPDGWFELGPHQRAISPEEVATAVVAGIFEDRFFISTHPEFLAVLQTHAADIDASVAGRLASLPEPPSV